MGSETREVGRRRSPGPSSRTFCVLDNGGIGGVVKGIESRGDWGYARARSRQPLAQHLFIDRLLVRVTRGGVLDTPSTAAG